MVLVLFLHNLNLLDVMFYVFFVECTGYFKQHMKEIEWQVPSDSITTISFKAC
jgi:hypothetical protein